MCSATAAPAVGPYLYNSVTLTVRKKCFQFFHTNTYACPVNTSTCTTCFSTPKLIKLKLLVLLFRGSIDNPNAAKTNMSLLYYIQATNMYTTVYTCNFPHHPGKVPQYCVDLAGIPAVSPLDPYKFLPGLSCSIPAKSHSKGLWTDLVGIPVGSYIVLTNSHNESFSRLMHIVENVLIIILRNIIIRSEMTSPIESVKSICNSVTAWGSSLYTFMNSNSVEYTGLSSDLN